MESGTGTVALEQVVKSHKPELLHGTEVTNVFHDMDDGSSELAICKKCKMVISDITGVWQHIPDLYMTTWDLSR